MKIAFNGLVIDKYKAGVGHYGYNLMKSLINKISQYDNIDITFFLQQDINIESQAVKYYKKFISPSERMLNEQFLFPLKLKMNDYDLVHYIDYSSSIINFNQRFLTTIHDLTFLKYPETFPAKNRKLKTFLTPYSIKRSEKIITISENTKSDIINFFPEAQGKIKVIYPGKGDYRRVENFSIIEKVKIKYNLPDNYILFVGTMEPRKNISRLIEAFEIIYSHNKDISLVLLGGKGWLYKEIFNKIEYSKAKSNIRYIGYAAQADMPAIYSGSNMLVYPSLYEGFGLPPLEAMSCGVPVIVSDTSSLPEVVGDAGLYIDPYNVESISERINNFLIDSNLREECIRKGLLRADKFNWDSTAEQIIDIYREI
ncbi:spore coat protein SA [Oxobacter pfennigii]|uniref:Spore coat protein SA n=1 Tax=Oxobacter pfennigii TaxID=36849 RepID=A0A0P8W520_9CLOT|nr:glycosyltransferase family 1 protein [Oxobacter pfennigii]KPU43695.1 spore coat protein SA [Oxobacter pfennigii]